MSIETKYSRKFDMVSLPLLETIFRSSNKMPSISQYYRVAVPVDQLASSLSSGCHPDDLFLFWLNPRDWNQVALSRLEKKNLVLKQSVLKLSIGLMESVRLEG